MSKIESVHLAIINILKSLELKKFTSCRFGSYYIRSMAYSDIPKIKALYAELEGTEMSFFSKLVLKLCGGKLCAVVLDGDSVVGFEHYYFNKRDISDDTVHEGYIGIHKNHQGKGIASTLRKHCADHFRSTKLKGISTRISCDNAASMASALKTGFEPQETYIDPLSNEKRAYLISFL